MSWNLLDNQKIWRTTRFSHQLSARTTLIYPLFLSLQGVGSDKYLLFLSLFKYLKNCFSLVVQ